jgi:peptidoglycan/LPS O-acetylase OafA/YrhL
LAASAVIACHVENEKAIAHLPNFALYLNEWRCGYKAVLLFFVLSGFLITYLLLKEFNSTGAINIGSFYARRILRIWPLYFLTVAIAFFGIYNSPLSGAIIASHQLSKHYLPALGLFIAFLPNLAGLMYEPVAGAVQCWSLGVEEQFYFCWPLLLGRFIKSPLRIMYFVILIKGLLLLCMPEPSMQRMYVHLFSIEAMAAGGIAAYYFLYCSGIKGWKSEKIAVALCAILSILTCLVCKISAVDVAWIVGSAVVVVSAASIRKIGGRLYPVLDYLGKISYGIYMLHPLAVLIAVDLLNRTHLHRHYQSICIYMVTCLLTILFAATSYKYFESPILRLKKRFDPTVGQVPLSSLAQPLEVGGNVKSSELLTV